MKSVGFIVDVSAAVGMGHLSRSTVLARSLSPNARVHVYLLGTLSERFQGIVESILTGLSWSTLPQLDRDDERTFDIQPGKLEMVSSTTVDTHNAWLVDLSKASQMHFAQNYLPILQRAMALDWFMPQHLPAMTISLVDHGNVMRNAYASNESDKTGPVRLLTGAAFAILKPQIVRLAKDRKNAVRLHDTQIPVADSQGLNVLLTFGGSDPSARTIEALKLVVPLAEYISQLTIVIGALNETEQQTLHELLADIAYQIVFNPKDFDRRLSKADVVFCGGGGTLLEAMHLGKPCVVIAQNSDEFAHAACYEQLGACIWPERMADVLRDKKLRRCVSQAAERQVDGRGVARIMSRLMTMIR